MVIGVGSRYLEPCQAVGYMKNIGFECLGRSLAATAQQIFLIIPASNDKQADQLDNTSADLIETVRQWSLMRMNEKPITFPIP